MAVGFALSVLTACSASPPAHAPQDSRRVTPSPKEKKPAAKSATKPPPKEPGPRTTDEPQKTWPLRATGVHSVATDPLGLALTKGGVLVVGSTTGALPGAQHLGAEDAFIVLFDERLQRRTYQKQFGTPTRDVAHDIREKDGVFYIAGATGGSIEGQAHHGGRDGFLQKRRVEDGAVLWTVQLGTPLRDEALGVGIDMMGDVFIAGTTRGALEGRAQLGERDVFVQKYSPEGRLRWTTTLGQKGDDELAAFRLGNLGEPQVLFAHDAGPMKLNEFGDTEQPRAQSIVRLDDSTGTFLDGAHFVPAGQSLPIAVNGKHVRLRWLPTDWSYDFALAPGGDWLLATGEMNTDGMCPSHDGDIPSVERLSVSAGRTKWKQVAALQSSFSTMERFESSSVSDVDGAFIYEAGVSGMMPTDVYVRKIHVRNGAEEWLTELDGRLTGTPKVAAAGSSVVAAWRSWDTSKGSEPARLQRFDLSTGESPSYALLEVEKSEVPARPEPGAPVEFCGKTYSGEAESTQVVCRKPRKILDLSPLLLVPHLDSLYIEGALIADLSVLSQLTTLKRLSLTESQINNLSTLSSLVHLEELNLSNNEFGDLSPLSSLSHLKILNLTENNLFSLAPLGALSGLQELILLGSTFPSLDGLEAISDLRELDLSHLKKLPPLAPIAKHQSLSRLRLAMNKKMDLTPLSKAESLTHLDVSYCNRLDLAPLVEMKALHFVDLTGQRKEAREALVEEKPDLELWPVEYRQAYQDSSEDTAYSLKVEELREAAQAETASSDSAP